MIIIFENFDETKPQIGDYVCTKDDTHRTYAIFDIRKKLDNFLSNNVGNIVDIEYESDVDYPYNVQYDNIPTELNHYFEDNNISRINCRRFDESEILFFSKNKEDVETYIEANKYNI